MADRTKVETGSEQRTLLTREKGNPAIGYDGKEISNRDDEAILEAQNIARKQSERDERNDEVLPMDPIDPASGKTRGAKNPHQPS